MTIGRLLSAELSVDDIEAARAFHVEVLGLHEIAEEGDAYCYAVSRGRSCALVLRPGGTGVSAFVFGVDSTEDLDYYTRRLESAGVSGQRRTDTRPQHQEIAAFQLPTGHTMELVVTREPLYHHMVTTNTGPSVGASPRDIDHITIAVPEDRQMRELVEILEAGLGFSTSDVIARKSGEWVGAWTRAGELHHDLALLRCQPGETLHHLAWTVDGMDHMKTAADNLARGGVMLETGPGRHGVGGNLYTYFWTPGGNRYELSAEMPRLPGGRQEPLVRLVEEFNAFSAWGAPRPESFVRGS